MSLLVLKRRLSKPPAGLPSVVAMTLDSMRSSVDLCLSDASESRRVDLPPSCASVRLLRVAGASMMTLPASSSRIGFVMLCQRWRTHRRWPLGAPWSSDSTTREKTGKPTCQSQRSSLCITSIGLVAGILTNHNDEQKGCGEKHGGEEGQNVAAIAVALSDCCMLARARERKELVSTTS